MKKPSPTARLYGKCSKIWDTLPAKKALTNSADPGQTASEEAVWSGSSLFAISDKHFVISSPDSQHFIEKCMKF